MVEDLQIVLLNKPPASALPVRLLADQLNQQIFTPSQPSIASELIVGFTEKALAQKYYSALPIHCFHNDLGIAFRYHSVDNENLLVENHSFEKINSGTVDDKIFYVSSEYLSQLWNKIKQELDKVSNKEK